MKKPVMNHQNLPGFIKFIDSNTIFSKYVSIYLELPRQWSNGSWSCIFKISSEAWSFWNNDRCQGNKYTGMAPPSAGALWFQGRYWYWIKPFSCRFFNFLFLLLKIGDEMMNYFRNMWTRDQGVHCFKFNVWLSQVYTYSQSKGITQIKCLSSFEISEISTIL